MQQGNIDDDAILRKQNEECFGLTNYILRNIDLKKYYDVNKKSVIALASLATIFSSLIIFFLFEVFRVYFFALVIETQAEYSVTYDIITLILRGSIAFLLAREIINFRLLYANGFDTKFDENEKTEFHIHLPKSALIKLLAF